MHRCRAGLLAGVLLLCGALPASARDEADERRVLWLEGATGRLLLLFRGDEEVARRFEPAPGAEGVLAPSALTGATYAWPGGRAKLELQGGCVTSVRAWDAASGRPLTTAEVPEPPAPLARWFDWPGSRAVGPTADDLSARVSALLDGPSSVDARVDAIVAEEREALAADAAAGTELPTTGDAALQRSITVGLTRDATSLPNAADASASTTDNFYAEYATAWSHETERALREMNGRGALGSRWGELSLDYAMGSPGLARHQWRVQAQGSAEVPTRDEAEASTFDLGLNATGERVLTERVSLLGSLGSTWLQYGGGDPASRAYDSRQLDASVGGRFVVGSSDELTASLTLQSLGYPDDPGADYDRLGLQASARGERGSLAFDASLGLTAEDQADGSVSAATGTTADDHEELELSATATWTFEEQLSGSLRLAHGTKDWSHPGDTNFDSTETSVGPGLDWAWADGWSMNLGSTWSWLRYRDRDGDDGTAGAAVDETLDDQDSFDLQVAVSLQQGSLQLTLSQTWDATHYPRSGQTALDTNVDGRGRTLSVSMAWAFAEAWSFDCSWSRDQDTYRARPEDDTVARALAASLRKTF